jgi:hypothetical protein
VSGMPEGGAAKLPAPPLHQASMRLSLKSHAWPEVRPRVLIPVVVAEHIPTHVYIESLTVSPGTGYGANCL